MSDGSMDTQLAPCTVICLSISQSSFSVLRPHSSFLNSPPGLHHVPLTKYNTVSLRLSVHASMPPCLHAHGMLGKQAKSNEDRSDDDVQMIILASSSHPSNYSFIAVVIYYDSLKPVDPMAPCRKHVICSIEHDRIIHPQECLTGPADVILSSLSSLSSM